MPPLSTAEGSIFSIARNIRYGSVILAEVRFPSARE
jgi:hypothetical protein